MGCNKGFLFTIIAYCFWAHIWPNLCSVELGFMYRSEPSSAFHIYSRFLSKWLFLTLLFYSSFKGSYLKIPIYSSLWADEFGLVNNLQWGNASFRVYLTSCEKCAFLVLLWIRVPRSGAYIWQWKRGSWFLSHDHGQHNPALSRVQVTEPVDLSLGSEISVNETLFHLPFTIMSLFWHWPLCILFKDVDSRSSAFVF